MGVFVNKTYPLAALRPRLTGCDLFMRGRNAVAGLVGSSGSYFRAPAHWWTTKMINRFCLVQAYGSHVYFRDYIAQGSDYRFDVQLLELVLQFAGAGRRCG